MATVNYTVFDGEIVEEDRGGTKRGYVPDPLGSTKALVDSAGAVQDTWEYWPYGEVESHTGSSTTPFTFVGTLGYFRDLVSSLTYVRARFYQAFIGQWMTMDPIWPLEAAYGYCRTRPCEQSDETGLSCTFMERRVCRSDCHRAGGDYKGCVAFGRWPLRNVICLCFPKVDLNEVVWAVKTCRDFCTLFCSFLNIFPAACSIIFGGEASGPPDIYYSDCYNSCFSWCIKLI